MCCRVDAYPEEDTECRVTESTKVRGGNATNTLVVAAQLGARSCTWIGQTADPASDASAAYALSACMSSCRTLVFQANVKSFERT